MNASCCLGVPKGVLLTHGNLLASISGIMHRFPTMRGPENRFIAYLPLAHVLELECELGMLGVAISIGYGSPLTLIDGASKLKKSTLSALIYFSFLILLAPSSCLFLARSFRSFLARFWLHWLHRLHTCPLDNLILGLRFAQIYNI